MKPKKSWCRKYNVAPEYPTIVHIYGAQCSGKSHVLRNIPKENKFDILDAYHKVGMRVEYEFSPRRYRMHYKDIHKLLNRFLRGKKDLAFIESSGNSKLVNRFLRVVRHKFNIIEIGIEMPMENELRLRAEKRGLKWDKVREFNERWIAKGEDRVFPQKDVERFVKTMWNEAYGWKPENKSKNIKGK